MKRSKVTVHTRNVEILFKSMLKTRPPKMNAECGFRRENKSSSGYRIMTPKGPGSWSPVTSHDKAFAGVVTDLEIAVTQPRVSLKKTQKNVWQKVLEVCRQDALEEENS